MSNAVVGELDVAKSADPAWMEVLWLSAARCVLFMPSSLGSEHVTARCLRARLQALQYGSGGTWNSPQSSLVLCFLRRSR
eukprot:654163-Amphidinium_carterae.1